MTKEKRITVTDEYAVMDRRGLYMSRFVALILIVGSVVAIVASLRVLVTFEKANAVHRARNEASHICIVELFGEGRHRAKQNLDWSPRESVAFYEECVDRVAATLIPPNSVRAPLRFRGPDQQTPLPTNGKKTTATPAPPIRYRSIYVPSSADNPTPRSTSAPRSTHRATPRPSRRPTPKPTPCNPACIPNPPSAP